MFRFFTRQFLTGLITILPLTLTAYLFYWFMVSTEKALRHVIVFVLPDIPYWPGMGFLVAIVLIFALGLMMRVYVFKKLFSKIEDLLYHMPLIKSVYGSIRDFFQYFSPSSESEFQQVVSVSFENGIDLIGFITIDDKNSLPIKTEEDRVLVYLPMSYNIGGYPIMIARNKLTPIDMTMEQAMRFVLTAGLAGPSKSTSDRQEH
ncbi:MAG TPA: DUF502 domain-containing protein [Methylophaga aminisulfidivorans]|uniref:DUF502 domain-containing protein n=2 Tax=root TaxID=1 RepID=A0A7C1VPQ1_9GAMM|nr:DUF502 domain-containing protein [Methylophaga aminisulfidivorans]